MAGVPGIGPAEVKLTSLAQACADLAGQKPLHIGGRHQPKRRPAEVELGHARHIQHRLRGTFARQRR